MEAKYGSLEQLEKAFQKTQISILHVDLENWKYLQENPEKTITLGETIFTDDLNIGEIDIELLNMIKEKKPKSIRDLSKIIEKDISSIQPKIKKMEKEGLIKLKQGGKTVKYQLLIMTK